MKPIKYKIIDGVTHFYHDPADYFLWRKIGFATGDSGAILVKREGRMFIYKSFGTIEAPSRTRITISMMHSDEWSGPMSTDDEIIAPVANDWMPTKESYRMVIMDLGEPTSTDLFGKKFVEMRALWWKQPFASLMLAGKIETRVWSTDYRGQVLICASKSSYSNQELQLIAGGLYNNGLEVIRRTSPRGMAIAVGRLVDCRPMVPEDEEKCFVKYRAPWIEERKSKKTGKIRKVKVQLWCHIYEDVREIVPFEFKGALGWKKLDQETINKIVYV